MKQALTTMICVLFALAPNLSTAEDSLHETIQNRESEWSAAYNANSQTDLGAFYEEDAVLIPPGSPPINGRAAIAEFFSTLFSQLKDIKLVTDEVRPLGPNHALEIGHSEYTAIAKDGSRSPVVDDYQVVWHRGDDDVWRYVTDMFNAR